MSPSPGAPSLERRVRDIRALGQALWVRGLRRRLVGSGRLEQLGERFGVSGFATDLESFVGAMSRGGEYAGVYARWASQDDAPSLDRLLAEEARIVAESLTATFEESQGRDGFACVDVDASALHDAAALAIKARGLYDDAGLPNVMIKLPPTESAFAVFEAMLIDGVPVFIGPLFRIESMRKAADAFARAHAVAPGAATGVAAFGLASLDSAIDEILRRRIRASGQDTSALESLLGSAAIATAKVAWRRSREALLEHGIDAAQAGGLRLAWVDLAPADPRQPRQHYVERLIGPDTIAIPDAVLLQALRHCAEPEATLGRGVNEAENLLAELDDVAVDIDVVGTSLEEAAVRQTVVRYARLDQQAVELAALAAANPSHVQAQGDTGSPLSSKSVEVADVLFDGGEPGARDAVARLWDKDASLWSTDERVAELVRHRLGWLDAAVSGGAGMDAQRSFADGLEEAGVERVVLVGMGGSSLATDVCRRVFDENRVRVLDSTSPARVNRLSSRIDPARTLVLLASKSGTTIEVKSLFDCFYALAAPMLDTPGDRFVATTDPGTPLEQTAHERAFRGLWLAPPDVGGRFSALTVFGTLPMWIMGVDASAVLRSAREMAAACAPEVRDRENPAARLAAALHHGWTNGRDKLTFLAPPPLSAFGMWAEQLVAESTGKQGKGLIPVVDEPLCDAGSYGQDRLFVSLTLADSDDREHQARVDAVEDAGHPVVRIGLAEPADLGGEFFRWEAAVALLGALMDIDPFDQPDVQAAKDRTTSLLAEHRQGTPMSDRPPLAEDTGWAVFADLEGDGELSDRHEEKGLAGWLRAHLGRAQAPDYIAIQAFLAGGEDVEEALQELRAVLTDRLGVATTLGWGPAFLHSTGQLHKGGPDSGVFLQLTADSDDDIDVPGAGYTLGELFRAQSLGDLAALQERGRRVMRVHLRDEASGCRELVSAAVRAFGT